MKYLLDTNVVSELMRRAPDSGVEAKFDVHRDECVICAITWHELHYGVARLTSSRRRDLYEEFLNTVVGVRPPLPYEARAAEWHAAERARLEAAGRSIPPADGQIAAIAAVNGLTLVTRNSADFRGLKGLKIQRWHERGE